MQLLPQTSALQQQTGTAWSNYISQPNAATTANQQANPFLTNLLNSTPGQGVLDAATPIFNRNLQQGADTLRQAGPRFNSNTERLVANQGQQAMQDFNLFSQQVMQEGINQQLTGAGLLGQLGQSADQSTLAGMSGAGDFANQMQGLNLSFLGPLMQQFFGTAFGAGGMTQPGTVTQGKSIFENMLGVASQGASIAGSLGGMPGMGGGGGGATSPFVFPQQPMNTFNPPPFGASFGQGWGWR